MFAQKLLHHLLNLLFPQKALVKELESISAEEFIKKVPRSSLECAFFSYRHPLMRQAIWEIKYANNQKVFQLLGQVLSILLAAKAPSIMIPLPLSAKRRRERGYNQTEELAKRIRTKSGNLLFRLDTKILKKKHTTPQTKMIGRQNRLTNIKGSFEVTDAQNPKTIQYLQENTFIILDDVTTTGATLTEAAGALKASGARQLLCIALAH